MAEVTVLGAGDMGTALTTPLTRNGHHVRLCGTSRDTEIVSMLQASHAHPRLKLTLSPRVTVYAAAESAEALNGADVVVVAITSDAVRTVLRAVADQLDSPHAVLTVAKGFDGGPGGDDLLMLPDVIAEFCDAPVVAVGGPSKANEVAHGLPTAVVFGGADAEAVATCRRLFATPHYAIEATTDIIGLEIAAAMKNAYAIALGIADGLEQRTGQPHHNLRAALFPRAVTEMALFAAALGGDRATVAGLAGSGDLQVTLTSGRNRMLGERIGTGEAPAAAYTALSAAGTTIEGYPAADYGYRWLQRLVSQGTLTSEQLPLLTGLWRILYADASPLETLWSALRTTEAQSVTG